MGLFDGVPDSSAFGFNNPAILGLLAGLGQAAAPSRMPVPFGSVIGQAAGGLLGGQRAGLEMQGQQQKLTQGNAALGQLLDQMKMAAKYYGTEAPTMADLKSGKFEGLLNKGFPTPVQQPAAPQAQPQSLLSQQLAATPDVRPAVATGGPPDVLLSAIHQLESGGRIEGVPDSKAGAIGPMQVIPSTGAQYGVSPDQLRNPEINLSVGKQYVTDMWQRYNGDPEATAVAYNAGPKRADMWLASGKVDKLLPQETQQYLVKVRQQLGAGETQYAQNAVNPATMTDAGGGGMPAPAQAPGSTDPSAIRAALAAQQYMFPGAKPTDALNALVAAGMMPQGSFPQQLLTNEALNKSGVKPFLGGERAGVPIRQYNAATGRYDIVGQNPSLDRGQIYNGQSISNVPGYIPSATAATSAIDWAKVPPAMFQKGVQVQPGGVAPVPGMPQTEGALAAGKAGGAAAAEAGVKYGGLVNPEGAPTPLTPQPGMPQAGAAQPGAPQSEGKPIPSQSRFGTLVPPPTPTSQPQFRSPAEADRAMQDWGKTTAKWTEAVEPAAQAEQRLHTIAQALKVVQSGKFTEQKANLAAVFASLGIDASKYLVDPAQAQLALHENAVGTLARLKSYTSRFTQQEFKTITAVSENPNLTPEANQQMLAEDMATLRRAQALPIDWAQAHSLGWSNPRFIRGRIQQYKSPWPDGREHQEGNRSPQGHAGRAGIGGQ